MASRRRCICKLRADRPCTLRDCRAARFAGWGKTDAAPILALGLSAVAYDFDPRASTVEVLFTDGVNEEQIDFPTFSGDWFCASLSRDGDLLVLAEPYSIKVYRTSQ